MNLLAIFFSFKGRTTRSQFWLGWGVHFCLNLMIYLLLAAQFLPIFEIYMRSPDQAEEALMQLFVSLGALLPFFVVFGLVQFVSVLSIYTKRLHDRNKGAIWLLAIYLPSFLGIIFFPLAIVGIFTSLWFFIELGFFRGTDGPNQYDDGPAPGAYLDDVFGKTDPNAQRGVGGMEGALAAIKAAARDQGSMPKVNQPTQASNRGFGGDSAPQFGKRVAPAYGGFNATPNSGGFGRRV